MQSIKQRIRKRSFIITRLQELEILPTDLSLMNDKQKQIHKEIWDMDFSYWEIIKEKNGWNNTTPKTEEERFLLRKRKRIREYLRQYNYLPPFGEPLNEDHQKIIDDIENNNFTFFDEVKEKIRLSRCKSKIVTTPKTKIVTPPKTEEERYLQRKREKARQYLRQYNYLPPYGTSLNEEQEKIIDDIENNNFTFFESIKDEKHQKTNQSRNYENHPDYKPSGEPKYVFQKLRMCQILPAVGVEPTPEQENIIRDVYDNWLGKKTHYFLKKYLHLSTPEGRMLFRAFRKHRKEGYNFNLTIEDIIIPTNCPILNIPLTTKPEDHNLPNYYSIDRIDSAKGYVKGNVQIISIRANKMKSNATQTELLQFATKTLELFKNEH